MHRMQFCDYCNQSFGRARCAPVRQTNLICRRVFNDSTIRPSQNGSNACSAKKRNINSNEKENSRESNNETQSSYAAFIGLDKSDKKLNVSLQRRGENKIERSIIKGGA